MAAKPKGALSAACLAFFLFTIPTAHATKPQWSYRVLESPHFEIIYRREQKELAKRYILAAEQAYEILLPQFNEGPDKTIIFLRDDTDLANGEADFLPYPHIVVYPVLPSTLDSIDEYGDWAFEMILHEYTHILNMYPAHGIYWPFKYLFGSVVRPNAVLPKWYLEGLAVETESLYTDHGRLRSSETAASARALVLADLLKKENIGTIGQQTMNSWPFGSRPYLYGGWWWAGAVQDKGTGIFETWNQNFSRRLPFLLNEPIREQTGLSANEVLMASLSKIEAQAKKEIDAIQASHPSQGQSIADEKGEQSVFALSPSGNKLVYWDGTREDGSLAKLKVRAQEGQDFKDIKGEVLFKSNTLQVRWLDEDRFIFDAFPKHDLYVTYRDLFIYDTKSQDTTRLTVGARAQEPAVSPDGKNIVFIQSDGGRNRLALLSENGQIKPLVNGNYYQRLSGPEFLNADQILFTVRQRSGQESLYVYDLLSRKATPWTDKLKSAQNLRKVANGFLITDAGTGVRNVYWIHDGLVDAVSNTLTDIETADYDPQRKQLVVSELTGTGHALRSYPLQTFTPAQVSTTKLPPPPKPSTESVPLKEESYQPLTYMRPRYWVPFIYQVERGLLFQGITANNDPAGRNAYSLSGSYDTVSKRGSYGAEYMNSSTPVDIDLSYNKFVTYLGASDIILESQLAGLTFATHWPWQNRNESLSLGGFWYQTESTSSAYRRIGPAVGYKYSSDADARRKWFNFFAEAQHIEFMNQPGYLAYGHSYLHLANVAKLSGEHKLTLHLRSSLAPKMPFRKVLVLGDPNIGGNYAVNLTNSNFLLRGYPSGEFVGRKVLNGNLEYSFAPVHLEKGMGTFPLFIQDMESVLFVDGMAVDGAGYDTRNNAYVVRNLGEFNVGMGGELRFATTVAYHLPMTVTFGLYYGADSRFGGGISPFFSLGFENLSGLQDKTP